MNQTARPRDVVAVKQRACATLKVGFEPNLTDAASWTDDRIPFKDLKSYRMYRGYRLLSERNL